MALVNFGAPAPLTSAPRGRPLKGQTRLPRSRPSGTISHLSPLGMSSPVPPRTPWGRRPHARSRPPSPPRLTWMPSRARQPNGLASRGTVLMAGVPQMPRSRQDVQLNSRTACRRPHRRPKRHTGTHDSHLVSLVADTVLEEANPCRAVDVAVFLDSERPSAGGRRICAAG